MKILDKIFPTFSDNFQPSSDGIISAILLVPIGLGYLLLIEVLR
jgi:hypothetical protein